LEVAVGLMYLYFTSEKDRFSIKSCQVSMHAVWVGVSQCFVRTEKQSNEKRDKDDNRNQSASDKQIHAIFNGAISFSSTTKAYIFSKELGEYYRHPRIMRLPT